MISPARYGLVDSGPAVRQVTFGSCYVYSPSGTDAASKRSRILPALLKAGDARCIVKCVLRVRQQVSSSSTLAGFFLPTDVLVPIPGSAPAVEGIVPVAERLALAMIEAGLGQRIWKGLHRIRAVRKSATARPGSRPTVGNHYDSFAIEPAGSVPQVLLIDDVVTKGRTLLAAAERVREACPNAEIRAFALVRTKGLVEGVNRLLDPCIGEIRWRAGDAQRNP